MFSISGLRLYFPDLEPWVLWSVLLPRHSSQFMHECGAAGSASHHLVGCASCSLACPFHNPPSRWVRQPPRCRESSSPRLPISTPPTGLDECFFFISLVVRLPCSSIFWQFWLFFVFKLLSFWLCEEAVCLPMPPSWPEEIRNLCISKS